MRPAGIFCAVAALAAVSTTADAQGLGSVLGAVTAAPRAIVGGLLGGSGARHSRHRHGTAARTHTTRAHASRANAARAAAAHAAPAVAAAPAITPATDAPAKPLDRAASTFWPSAYEDALGYILLPADNSFWAHGYADAVAGMFSPAAGLGGSDRRGRAGRAPVAQAANPVDAGTICQDPENLADGLIARVGQAVDPTEAQRDALADLGTALRNAAHRVRAACASEGLTGPAARLESAWHRLRALRQAVAIVRTPLRKFLDGLSEEQMARLVTAGAPAPDVALRACSEGARMLEWPIEPIARTIRPTEDQRPQLELLVGTSLHIAGQLRKSCPVAAPLAPIDRLQAAEQRLTDLVYALTVLRGALNKFYASLTDEQRARFDSMGLDQAGRRVELR
jgi:hypothetical protein